MHNDCQQTDTKTEELYRFTYVLYKKPIQQSLQW